MYSFMYNIYIYIYRYEYVYVENTTGLLKWQTPQTRKRPRGRGCLLRSGTAMSGELPRASVFLSGNSQIWCLTILRDSGGLKKTPSYYNNE